MKKEKYIISQSVTNSKKVGEGAEIIVANAYNDKTEKNITVKITAQEVKAFKACKNQFDACKVVLAIYNRYFTSIKASVKAPRRILQNTLARLFSLETQKHDLYQKKNKKKKTVSKKTAKKNSTKKKAVQKETEKIEELVTA